MNFYYTVDYRYILVMARFTAMVLAPYQIILFYPAFIFYLLFLFLLFSKHTLPFRVWLLLLFFSHFYIHFLVSVWSSYLLVGLNSSNVSIHVSSLNYKNAVVCSDNCLLGGLHFVWKVLFRWISENVDLLKIGILIYLNVIYFNWETMNLSKWNLITDEI